MPQERAYALYLRKNASDHELMRQSVIFHSQPVTERVSSGLIVDGK